MPPPSASGVEFLNFQPAFFNQKCSLLDEKDCPPCQHILCVKQCVNTSRVCHQDQEGLVPLHRPSPHLERGSPRWGRAASPCSHPSPTDPPGARVRRLRSHPQPLGTVPLLIPWSRFVPSPSLSSRGTLKKLPVPTRPGAGSVINSSADFFSLQKQALHLL